MSHAAPQPARDPVTSGAEPESADVLFHRLNNLLGVVLVNAELLEAKAPDGPRRPRAGQVVASVLDALATARPCGSGWVLGPDGPRGSPPRLGCWHASPVSTFVSSLTNS
jgi:hypothetical protein